MDYVGLGKANLMASRVGFGAMSLKDVKSEEDAALLVHRAYDAGVNFFDISHTVPESEKRLGACLSGIRHNVILSTKAQVLDSRALAEDLEASLDALQSDYVDLFQYEVDEKGLADFDEICAQMKRLQERKKIRHFGLASENLEIAKKALDSGLFETIQAPFNLLLDGEGSALVQEAAKKDIGFVAMKPLYGGLVQNIPLALGYLYQFENVVPLWGVRSLEELEQILYFNERPPVIDEQFKAEAEKVRDFFN